MLRRSVLFVALLYLLAGCAAPARRPAPRPAPPPAVVKPVPPPAVPAPPAREPAPEIVAPPPEAPKPPVPPVAPKPVSPLTRVPDDRLPLFADDMDLESLEAAVEKSLQYYKRAAGRGSVRMDDRSVSIKELQDSLISLREILRSSDPAEVRQERIRQEFDVYQSTGSDGKNAVLFTGYYEASLKGSSQKTEKFRYPIYSVPNDLVIVDLSKFGEKYKNEQLVGRMKGRELLPYYSRSEIENQGALAGRDIEIAWVDDRFDLFLMHIQGSGKIELTDGRLLQVGYALKNGRPFQSIGAWLLKTGRIAPQQISNREIKRYLREHPDEMPEILAHNESFIFFRVVPGGPVGAIEEILTSGRSIATDPDLFPKGALAFIRTRKPVLDAEGKVESWIPYSRFVVSQDVGSAIKGAGRVDLFCGHGREAEMVAGSLKERGELYFLVKKRVNSGEDQRNARK